MSEWNQVNSEEIMEKYEKESRTRKFGNLHLNRLIYVLCLAFTIYHLAYASGIRLLQMVNIKHHAIHVGLRYIRHFAKAVAKKSVGMTGFLLSCVQGCRSMCSSVIRSLFQPDFLERLSISLWELY